MIIPLSVFITILKTILGNAEESFEKKWLIKYQKISGNQTPPMKYKEWIKLATRLGCSTDPSDYEQIFKDLRPYKKIKLTVEKLRQFKRKLMVMGRDVTGRDMEKFSEMTYTWPFQSSLAYLDCLLDPSINFYAITHVYDESFVAPADDNQTLPYSDMADLVSRCKAVRDAHKKYIDNNMLFRAPTTFIAVPFDVPVFSANRLKGFKDIILPTDRTGLVPYIHEEQVALDAPVWEKKIMKAVFRGRTTGVNFKKVREENIPLTQNLLFKLHEMSMKQRRGELTCSVPLDFGITEIWQCEENESYIEEVKRRFPLVPALDYETQFKSKYLVVVDGNGWPDRVALYLLSGSLVFLATVHEEWVINQLVDGEHYIKIKPDLSDLIEKLEWAAKNDSEAKRIASNGRELAMKKFNTKSMQIYNALLFMEYQRLFS